MVSCIFFKTLQPIRLFVSKLNLNNLNSMKLQSTIIQNLTLIFDNISKGISKHACTSLCFHLSKVFTDQCIMSYDNIRQFLTPSSPRNILFSSRSNLLCLYISLEYNLTLSHAVSIIFCVFKWVYRI